MTLQLITVPAGSIVLRDDRLKRTWHETVASFLLSPYPVTQQHYQNLVGVNPSVPKAELAPVVNVSWLDAVRFCNLLSQQEALDPYYDIPAQGSQVTIFAGSTGYRLPTDAEWEFACRAGTDGPRYGAVDDIAWYQSNSGGAPQLVGQKRPNAFCLFDMLGNVWEWCWDLYDPAVYGPYRIFRGGGWSDDARGCIASNRRRSHPSFTIDDLGFRVARSIER
ncbi:formylglycine-generating enzyme family protein [Reinekea blandensis]|uniref:Sulfatase-modifying factor enzyme-like domain-containing protein n=1 Tax=Reinekea blandensis MED297 TaxID=314283 RepID=A4BGR7_9GAMM|nr:SUMF1/EgtB/PvdO family nonheme iron enzyme [Reinekea blandensis]EAR08715.1 hypothetical protein MED297_14405 [Reinekea sp. MED297] [Reinekea blandensis MED297]